MDTERRFFKSVDIRNGAACRGVWLFYWCKIGINGQGVSDAMTMPEQYQKNIQSQTARATDTTVSRTVRMSARTGAGS